MESFRELQPGEVLEGLPSGPWNEFGRAAKLIRQIAPRVTPGASLGLPVNTVEVINATGADLDARFPVVDISQPSITYTDNSGAIDDPFLFNGAVPDANTVAFGICQAPVEDGQSVACTLFGPSWCQISVSDANHKYATTSSGDATKLVSGDAGIPIIWKEAGTGTKWAVVLVGSSLVDITISGSPADIIHFTLTADLGLTDTSAAATIITSTAGSSGSTTVYDEEAKFSALTGYKGYAYHDGTAYRILYLEGPARFGDFIATAASSETSETITATLEDLWGNPPNGVAPASLTGITVYKLPIDADATARYVPLKNGDKFRAIWDEVEEKWKLFWYPGLRVVVRAPYSSLIDENTTSITLAVGSGETAMQLVSGFVLPADDITVTCDPDMYRSGGTSEYGGYIYAAYNHQLSTDPNACWDAGDARNFLWHLQGIGSYDPAESMIILQDSNDDPEWAIAKEIDVITEITSLAVTGGNLVLTYKKGTFLVVKEVTAPASDTVTIPVVDPCA